MGANIGAATAVVNEFKSRKSVIRLTKVRASSSLATHIYRVICKKGVRMDFAKYYDVTKLVDDMQRNEEIDVYPTEEKK